jgi:hypothetical protein
LNNVDQNHSERPRFDSRQMPAGTDPLKHEAKDEYNQDEWKHVVDTSASERSSGLSFGGGARASEALAGGLSWVL